MIATRNSIGLRHSHLDGVLGDGQGNLAVSIQMDVPLGFQHVYKYYWRSIDSASCQGIEHWKLGKVGRLILDEA